MAKLIHLEEVERMLKSHQEKLMGLDSGVIQMLLNDLSNLHTIDPIEEIDNMIEELQENRGSTEIDQEIILEELKSRLSPNQK